MSTRDEIDRRRDALLNAVRRAGGAGVSVGDILAIVATGIEELTTPAEPVEPPTVPFYETLPDDLVALPDACRDHGVHLSTANWWIREGILKRRGKTRGPGGLVNVVDRAEFVARARLPRGRGGRPRQASRAPN